MFVVFKKRNICIGVGIIAIIIFFTVMFINTSQSESDDDVNNVNVNEQDGEAVFVSETESAVEAAKNDRDVMRSKIIEMLKSSMDDDVTEDFAKSSESEILKLAKYMDQESVCETILSAKGYENVAVFVSDETVTITIYSKKIEEIDVAKIKDIVFEQTGNNNIKIVEVG